MTRKRRGDIVNGWIAVDKPPGVTAAKVVARVKSAVNAAKAGHGGTLDPLATGVLPIALGSATKTVNFAMDSRKAYEFDVRWGERTDTDDSEGVTLETSDSRPSEIDIVSALSSFVGEIDQIPPDYSAVKVSGQRAYDLARKNVPLNLTPRRVIVHALNLVEIVNTECARFRVRCGKGTYVRALVRDLAQTLGTFGHISRLRRTQCGPFSEKSSISLEKLEALGHKAAASECLLPVGTVLDDIPALALTSEEARRITHGQSISLWPVVKRNANPGLEQGMTVQAVCGETLIAVAEVGNGMVRPVRVLNT